MGAKIFNANRPGARAEPYISYIIVFPVFLFMPTVPAGGEMRSMGRQKMLANLQVLRTDESL